MMENTTPLRFSAPVTLIGGGAVSIAALNDARRRAPHIIAADGGANFFQDDKSALEAIIGDIDSLRDIPAWRSILGQRLMTIAEQDTTDFEKCLYSICAPFYLAVGFLGGRHDHSLSATHVLLKQAGKRVVLCGEEDVVFLAPRRWRIRLPVGARVSLYPLRPVMAERSQGLRWRLDGLSMEIGSMVGTSNECDAEQVEVDFAGRGDWSYALASIDRAHLDAALTSLGLISDPQGGAG